MRILFIDDLREVLDLYGHLLRRMGHDVLLAESSDEALHVLQTTQIDLVLLDWRMPYNGGQVVLEWLAAHTDTAPRLVLQTAQQIENIPRHARISDVWHKPILPGQLQQLILNLQQKIPH